MMKSDFNIKLSRKMSERGMSAEELARLIKVTPRQVYNYKSGKSIPPGDKLILLMKIFGIQVLNDRRMSE